MKISEKSVLEKLKHLRILCEELFELKDKINDVFKVHILLFFFNSFCDMVFFAFLFIIMFQTNDDFFNVTYFNSTVMYSIGIINKTFLVSYVCHYTYKKARGIGIVINRLQMKMEDEGVQQQVS